MQKVVNLLTDEINKTNRNYTYNDITELLGKIQCPAKKFLTEVRKILKLKSSCPLWYGFSDELLSQNKYFKNKDEYARIPGQYKIYEGKKYNFICIPIMRSYYVYHYLEIEVNNGIVRVLNSFQKPV